jgi:cytochrome c oxidase cbb3-type subunit 4
MALFFVGAVAFAFRPGSRGQADEAARIPLKDD